MPSLRAPEVAVVAVRFDRLSGTAAHFTVVLDLVNRNDREIAVDTIEAELAIEALAVGTARLAAPLRLPAGGQARASLDVQAGWAAALRAIAASARRADTDGAAHGVRYAVTGLATLMDGGTVPFSRAGEFALPAGQRSLR